MRLSPVQAEQALNLVGVLALRPDIIHRVVNPRDMRKHAVQDVVTWRLIGDHHGPRRDESLSGSSRSLGGVPYGDDRDGATTASLLTHAHDDPAGQASMLDVSTRRALVTSVYGAHMPSDVQPIHLDDAIELHVVPLGRQGL